MGSKITLARTLWSRLCNLVVWEYEMCFSKSTLGTQYCQKTIYILQNEQISVNVLCLRNLKSFWSHKQFSLLASEIHGISRAKNATLTEMKLLKQLLSPQHKDSDLLSRIHPVAGTAPGVMLFLLQLDFRRPLIPPLLVFIIAYALPGCQTSNACHPDLGMGPSKSASSSQSYLSVAVWPQIICGTSLSHSLFFSL